MYRQLSISKVDMSLAKLKKLCFGLRLRCFVCFEHFPLATLFIKIFFFKQ